MCRNLSAVDVYVVISFITQVNRFKSVVLRRNLICRSSRRQMCALKAALPERPPKAIDRSQDTQSRFIKFAWRIRNMLEQLSSDFSAQKELCVKGRWSSAAFAVLLLCFFASSGWAEEASCHGAYDLYFVLDK